MSIQPVTSVKRRGQKCSLGVRRERTSSPGAGDARPCGGRRDGGAWRSFVGWVSLARPEDPYGKVVPFLRRGGGEAGEKLASAMEGEVGTAVSPAGGEGERAAGGAWPTPARSSSPPAPRCQTLSSAPSPGPTPPSCWVGRPVVKGTRCAPARPGPGSSGTHLCFLSLTLPQLNGRVKAKLLSLGWITCILSL